MGPGIRSAPRTTWGQEQHEKRRPWIGVWERINIGVWLLWPVVRRRRLAAGATGRQPRRPAAECHVPPAAGAAPRSDSRVTQPAPTCSQNAGSPLPGGVIGIPVSSHPPHEAPALSDTRGNREPYLHLWQAQYHLLWQQAPDVSRDTVRPE
jgi:hypothetical protein